MRLEVARRRGGRGKDVLGQLRGTGGPLFGREGERGLEEIEEGGLARGSGADDEDAIKGSAGDVYSTHLSGRPT